MSAFDVRMAFECLAYGRAGLYGEELPQDVSRRS
jgi:hypothetical protein